MVTNFANYSKQSAAIIFYHFVEENTMLVNSVYSQQGQTVEKQ